MKKIAIIGGGAAGLMCAVVAARRLHAQKLPVQVCVFEASDKVGRSILRSGNGRCNFSNAQIDPAVYHNAQFVARALEHFEACCAAHNFAEGPAGAAFLPPNGVVALFAQLGLLWRQESEGRLYPYANKASAVLDALRFELERLGVEVRVNSQVKSVEEPRTPGGPFTLRMADGAFERAAAVCVACGGQGAQGMLPAQTLAGARIEFEPQRPVLGPLAVREKLVKRLDNIRVRCEVALVGGAGAGAEIARERGELLFRKYGVSGIAIFNLSRLASPGDRLHINFVPEIPACELPQFLAARAALLKKTHGKKLTCHVLLQGILLPLVAQAVLERAGVDSAAPVNHAAYEQIAAALSQFELTVVGIGDAAQCQVHRGGVAVDQVSAESMEFHHVKGLYVLGEALDVDAPCGGFNLHWAFVTGALAGTHVAQAAGAWG